MRAEYPDFSNLRGGFQIAFAVMLMAVLALPASAQSARDIADLNDRINALERQLSAVQRGSARLPQDAVRSNVPASSAAQLSLRIDTVENQMRGLTGQLEEINFKLRKIADQLNRFTKDAELRFKDLEQGKQRPSSRRRSQVAPAPDREPASQSQFQTRVTVDPPPRRLSPPQQIGPPRPASPGPGAQRGVLVTPEDNSSLRKAAPPTTLGQIPADALGRQPDLAALNPENNPAETQDEAGALYERAYEQYLERRFAAAESSFRGFVRRFPRHKLTGQAQYWLGETFYARKDYRAAARAFLTGYRKFPKNLRAPETLLKLGMSLKQLGDKAQACATYAKLAREYPKASPGLKRAASGERRRAGC